jgi:hypothetical protein
MRTELGKIAQVSFGFGGYQDMQIGVSFILEGVGWGVGDFRGAWSLSVKVGEATKWKEEDRDAELANTVKFLDGLLRDAKKQTLDQLTGVPIEATFNGNTLASWRVLKEVL